MPRRKIAPGKRSFLPIRTETPNLRHGAGSLQSAGSCWSLGIVFGRFLGLFPRPQCAANPLSSADFYLAENGQDARSTGAIWTGVPRMKRFRLPLFPPG